MTRLLPIGLVSIAAFICAIVLATSSHPSRESVSLPSQLPTRTARTFISGPFIESGPIQIQVNSDPVDWQPIANPTQPADDIMLFRASMPEDVRSTFDAAYAVDYYDPAEITMGRLLYQMNTRTYYVQASEIPDSYDQLFLINQFPGGLTDDESLYLKTLLGIDTGAPVLRSRPAITSVIGSSVFGCFREARIYSPFVWLTEGEITSYARCIHSGRMTIVAGDSVNEAALNNTRDFGDEILNCLSPDLPPLSSIMLVLVPEATSLTDLAEFASLREQTAADGLVYSDHRGVATHGVAAVGEENVLDSSARFDAHGSPVGQTVVHELAHLIMDANDPLAEEAYATYDHAIASGLWADTYQGLNAQEYFAVLTSIMFGLGFDTNATDAAGLNIVAINGPTQLKAYDPMAYSFLARTYPCLPPA